MRLTALSIHNMRVFGEKNPLEVTLSPNKNLFVFVGNNGNGKTTLLDAIACQASVFISAFPKQALRNYSEVDVHIDEHSMLSPYLEVNSTFCMSNGETFDVTRIRKGTRKGAESQIRSMKAHAEIMLNDIMSGKHSIALPVIAYYDTERGLIQAPERRRDFPRTYDRWECYTFALAPATNFKRFFAWFDLMEDEERRTREELRDFDYHSPVLEAVRRAIASMLGEHYANPRIDIHPLRFVVDEMESGIVKRQLRMEQLSSGFKIMLAMVADLAARMAEANPNMADPLQSDGIVLIDEVEQHLHPQWQRKVLSQLHSTFPNVQFIVTTHSPLVLLGANNDAEIFHLEDRHIVSKASSDYSSYDVSLLLLSELFNIESVTSPQWDEKLKQREALMTKAILTEEEQKQLSVLNTVLRPVLEGAETNSLERIVEKILNVKSND